MRRFEDSGGGGEGVWYGRVGSADDLVERGSADMVGVKDGAHNVD